MNTEEIKNLVQQYFDGELDKNKEPMMFTLLSENFEAREFFKELNVLKSSLEETKEEFPFELEERILRSAGKQTEEKSSSIIKGKLFPVFAYAVAAILLIFSFYLLSQVQQYQTKVELVTQQVKMQNSTIEMLYNSLPAMEVKAKWDNEVIIKANL